MMEINENTIDFVLKGLQTTFNKSFSSKEEISLTLKKAENWCKEGTLEKELYGLSRDNKKCFQIVFYALNEDEEQKFFDYQRKNIIKYQVSKGILFFNQYKNLCFLKNLLKSLKNEESYEVLNSLPLEIQNSLREEKL